MINYDCGFIRPYKPHVHCSASAYLTPFFTFPASYIHIWFLPVSILTRLSLWIKNVSCAHVLQHKTVFSVETSVHISLCKLIPLIEISNHMLPYTPILSVETSVYVISLASLHVIPRSSLLGLTCAYFPMPVLPWSSVHLLLRQTVLEVAVLCLCLLLCTTL